MSRQSSDRPEEQPVAAQPDLIRQVADLTRERYEIARLFSEIERAQEETAQHAAQLEEVTKFLDSVIENIPITIFIKEARQLSYIRWNKAGQESIGFTGEELTGKTDYDFFPKEEADFFTAKDRETLAGKKLVDIPEEPIHTRRNGIRLLHTIKVPILNTRGEPEYLVGISEDITERQQAEAALRKVHDELELRVQARTAELMTANLALQAEIAERKRAEAVIQRRSEDLAALNMIATTLGQSIGLDQILHATLDRAVKVLELDGGWVQLLDGEKRTLELAAQCGIPAATAAHIKHLALGDDFTGQLTGPEQAAGLDTILDTVRDAIAAQQPGASFTLSGVPISSKEHMLGVLGGIRHGGRVLAANQVQLLATIGHQLGIAVENARLAEQAAEVKILREVNRLRSELIANVSHELRTPLGLIRISSSSLLMEDVAFGRATQRQFLHSIDEETTKLERIVEHLLDLGRMESGRLRLDRQPTDMGELAAAVIKSMATLSPAHRLSADLPAQPMTALVDAKRIEQVLRNLLDNAIKYSPNGGAIVVAARRHAATIQFSVRDPGIGIGADEWEKIFGRFYRVENEVTQRMRGAGLGLAVCQGIVEAHGGRIWLESKLGSGSTFHCTVPIQPRAL